MFGMDRVATFPQHPLAWTIEEVLALPEDQGQRIELVDGALVVSPAPGTAHQRALQRTQAVFDSCVPAGHELLPGINVLLGSRLLPIPDLVGTTVPGIDAVYCERTDLLLAVEVISPSSRAYDKVGKARLYADAGVPFLLLVDPAASPVSATCFELSGDGYREIAQAEDGTLVLTRPFGVTVDLG